MSKLQLTNKAEIVSFDDQKISLIKDTFGKGLTDTEFSLYLETAKSRGLDPVLKQIHAVKRQGQMTIQVGIDGYRLIASRTGDYAGSDEAVFDYDKQNKLTKATVTVYRIVQGTRCAFTASARWSEYYPGGNQAFMWNKMPETMLEKCAEGKALRKAFPGDLSGLYVNEEMHQADSRVVKEVADKAHKRLVATEPEIEAESPQESEAGEPSFVEVRVDYKDAELRQRIKSMGFSWNATKKVWLKTFDPSELEQFDFDYELVGES